MDELNNADIWASQIMEGELKEAINLFIWRWGHPQLTLAKAEKIAVSIFDMLSEEPSYKKPQPFYPKEPYYQPIK